MVRCVAGLYTVAIAAVFALSAGRFFNVGILAYLTAIGASRGGSAPFLFLPRVAVDSSEQRGHAHQNFIMLPGAAVLGSTPGEGSVLHNPDELARVAGAAAP
jgi:hypothetical protein